MNTFNHLRSDTLKQNRFKSKEQIFKCSYQLWQYNGMTEILHKM